MNVRERDHTMSAIAITKPGGPEVLALVRRPIPTPGVGELLIAVEAAGINNSDLMQRRGDYPSTIERPDVPGLEVSGHVVELGSSVSGFIVGQDVCALSNGGGYSEYCAVPAAQVLPRPRTCSAVVAAGLPEGLFTVWSNLFDVARLAAGEILLVHGGASGIGTLAIQLAHALGARVFATAGGPEKCAACMALGAEHAIDYRMQDFVEEVLQRTGWRGADVILDMVGGDYVMRNVACLARNGRVVNIAYPKGARVEVDFMELMRRGGSMAATMLRPRPSEEKAAIARHLLDVVWPLVDAGRICPVIAGTYPLADAKEAHRVFELGRHVGKLVLSVRAA